jgi:DNA-binding response OmpR family regulator
VRRVLFIDDEPGVRRLVRELLVQDGLEVTTADDGLQGLRLATSQEWDLVLLDLMLPDLPGTSVLSALLEARPAQRVMVLSAVGDTESRVHCLEHGAVDFVAKPFSVRELRARVRSRLAEVETHVGSTNIRRGDLVLDVARRRLVVGNRTVDLSPREFHLLAHLMRCEGAVCTRAELLNEVWGMTFDPGTNVVDVTVRRLRSKVRADVIETVRNVGYALAV